MAIVSKLIGKGLSKTAKKESTEVAKKSTEVMARKPEKFMGMAEEVSPNRLTGPAAEEAAKRGKSSLAPAVAAGAAVAGGVVGAAMSSRDKEEKAPSRSESKGSSAQEDRPVRDAGRVAASKEETSKESTKPATFGAAFKEARAAGKDVFTYEGKKYTTEMAGEKKAAPKAEAAEKPADKPTGVREGRNENIDEDTRKRAMASVANLAKGGMVVNKGIGASMKPHNIFGSKGKK